MDSRDAKKLTDAIIEVRRSLDKLGTAAKRSHLTNVSQTFSDSINAATLAQVPVKLDWTIPAIPGVATFIRRDNGTLKIEIAVQDDGKVMDLLEQMDVDALQLSVVEP